MLAKHGSEIHATKKVVIKIKFRILYLGEISSVPVEEDLIMLFHLEQQVGYVESSDLGTKFQELKSWMRSNAKKS